MKVFGLKKEHFELLRKILKKSIKNKDARAFLFGSRATGNERKNSDIDVVIKSGKELGEQINKLKDLVEDSDIPFKVDLVDWNEIVPAYKKNINKQKKQIWQKDEEINPWRICPVGEHWVKRHKRVLKNGTIIDRDGHCRKNRKGKDILTRDEITSIPTLEIFKKAKPKTSNKGLKFENGNVYNEIITGWTAYWNNVFKPDTKLHPNYVKALIASESGFKLKISARNKLNVGDAQGLVQLTEQTQKILKDMSGELNDHFIFIRKKDIWDPNINIAAAIRWLFRKKEIAKYRLKREPTWEEVLHEYKGILMQQKHPRAIKIKQKLKDYLNELGL